MDKDFLPAEAELRLPRFCRKKKLGLALGGGAVLGFAHIGVLKALTEAGFEPWAIAGTSAGSIFGGLFCAGLSWREIQDATKKISWFNLVTPAVPVMGLLKAEGLEKIIDKLVFSKNIEDLATPFRAVATDLATGKEVVLDKGPLARAIRISCGIPGIFVPFEDGDRLLADGGLVNNVPVDVVRGMGADYIIAVNVISAADGKKPRNIVEVIYRSILILQAGINPGKRQADILVRPNLARFSAQDISKKEEIIAAGEEAMRELLPHIKALPFSP
ncbi:MAG: patatin-like phospholipase family protein [Spirochaetales bacterium]|nr:patatin-like phospholipase family protein [Spirochaetales bacterium]